MNLSKMFVLCAALAAAGCAPESSRSALVELPEGRKVLNFTSDGGGNLWVVTRKWRDCDVAETYRATAHGFDRPEQVFVESAPESPR